MTSVTSYENLVQQVESLKQELAQCRDAEEISRENELKYQRVLESSSEGFMLLNRQQRITEVNDALMKVSGYRRQDFLFEPLETFYDKATVGFYSASRDHLSFEASFRSRDGRMIPMLFSRSTLKDDAGGLTGYMYFLTDLTELKATQQELTKAEQRYRSMYENAVQGMFQSRLSGELIRVNPSYAAMLGYGTPDEVLALKEGDHRFYFSDEDRTRMIRAVKKNGAVVNHELRLKRKDGKPIWILANIRLINGDQGDDLLEGILVDNTVKKALEKQLRRDRQKFPTTI